MTKKTTAPKGPSRPRRIAIYAFYDGDGIVSDFVTYKLKALRHDVDEIVVVCNGEVDAAGRDALAGVADSVHFRDNSGYDIWGFRTGLIDVVGWERLATFDEVVLLNSTFYGPLFPFSEMFGEMAQRKADFWGITAFKGPVPNEFTFQGDIPFHIQSYFMVFRRRLVTHQTFQDYWERLPKLETYVDAVLKHEAQFTERFKNQGFRFSVFVDPDAYRVVNPVFLALDLLIEKRCPVLKRRPFFHEPRYLEQNNVELARALDVIRRTSDYDLGMVWRDITRTARPRDLHSNADLLEIVPSEGEAPVLKRKLKLAVLLHLSGVDQLPRALRLFDHLPVRADLHVTTPADQLAAVEEALAAASVEATVKATPVGVGETGALLLTGQEILAGEKYDYVCRIQTNASTGISYSRTQHFREHHYDNLLGSKTYVQGLLSLLEADPSLGLIAPPATHIAHSPVLPVDMGHARRWAERLGITAPLDSMATHVPDPTMFWARPAALKPLFENPVTAAELLTGDTGGDLPLSALIESAVFQSGHYVKRVSTPGSLARDYVRLEFKLQKTIAERPHVTVPTTYGEVKDYFRHHYPPAFNAARAGFRASRNAYLLARERTSREPASAPKQIEAAEPALPMPKRTATEPKRPLRRAMLYMLFTATGEVAEYIVRKLAAFREHTERVVVVCNGVLSPEGRDALEQVADVVHVRENVGFDVWAYRTGIKEVIGWENLEKYDELLLVNYTFYGPLFPLRELFSEMESRPLDFWGITAFLGPVPNFFTGEGVITTHIQSHFIAVRQPMLSSPEFRAYWEQMPPINSYNDSVTRHEIRFTEHFEKRGFSFDVYSDTARYHVSQVAYDAADKIIEDRCPILKRRVLFNDPVSTDLADVRGDRAMALIKAQGLYDVGMIWKDILPTSKPRDVYTNTTLLEVIDDAPARGVTPPKAKIAVLAHAYYPDLLPEMLAHAENIPVPFDLYVTTSSEEKRQAISKILKNAKGFKVRDVRVIENRGRDVAALLVGLGDVVRDGGYDYICRIHSKASPQDSFGMTRHFKDHLFGNLLASPGYVTRLLQVFENEPNAGVLYPPTIHIGFPTLGHSWFNNRDGAAAWAKKLGIRVPFDEHTPMCAHGSMYWFRPEALAPLFDYGFKFTDFPPEPHYADGDLPHILERLIVYCSHSQGYYGKCVLTPKNAAKNYVKLELKYQQLMVERHVRQPQPVTFPSSRVKESVLRRLKAPIARGLKVTEILKR